MGSEDITVGRSADGWTISSAGRIGPPLDLVTRQVLVRYTADWKPLELRIDASVRNQAVTIQTVVSGLTANTTLTQGGQTVDRTDAVPADAVLLPNPFFGPYEALAQRLKTARTGDVVHAYQAGDSSFQIEVGASSDETIQTASTVVRARRTAVKMLVPGTALDVEVWGDEAGHLLRLSVPAQDLEVVREDLASVAARRVTISRPNDEQVRVPANGFNLAGTISRPPAAGSRPLPAVILVAGSGPQDRDETVVGIPIFGQLASSLADAGFLVLRYDKRGVGQSGGRVESATMADYAEDLRAAVKFLSDRKDVNRRSLAVVGHSEGGSVAMLVAGREKKVTALVLVATVGVTGADLNIAQVTHALDRAKRPEAERQTTIELQKKIQTAVLTGKGWEGVPEPLRRRADIPWFKSFLALDPAKLMSGIKQPLLVVQGLLDTQVDPSNADRLEALAKSRRKAGAVDVVRIPGVNHLLVPAVTGEADEYASLKDSEVSPAVIAVVTSWLQKTAAAAR
ncbi:MAG: hypothetical protein A3H97_23585 [Acidobacteria bacterium RIFCSPLOWO2_02_FULL_65_29]|nr:MAG: hypothetical protein A3H97_23585 [Acidobacteria bacterium RIFCSPLOWO2_02_FULL_65_29]